MMEKEARLCYHAVPRIFPQASHLIVDKEADFMKVILFNEIIYSIHFVKVLMSCWISNIIITRNICQLTGLIST